MVFTNNKMQMMLYDSLEKLKVDYPGSEVIQHDDPFMDEFRVRYTEQPEASKSAKKK